MSKSLIYTIGHSTHPIDEFITILKTYEIKEVADIRTIPKSRHNPQYNEETLAISLKNAHIKYKHFSKLGGLRHTTKDSINTGWRNKSFRGYADYMLTQEFEKGLNTLQKDATKRTTVMMCAEAVPWRCHRSLVADALIKKKWNVVDIFSITNKKKHNLTSFLKMKKGKLIYPEIKFTNND